MDFTEKVDAATITQKNSSIESNIEIKVDGKPYYEDSKLRIYKVDSPLMQRLSVRYQLDDRQDNCATHLYYSAVCRR